MKRYLGTKAGSSYEFGVRDAKDVESYGKNIKVVEEWSYFEDEDIIPKFLRLFRNFKFISFTAFPQILPYSFYPDTNTKPASVNVTIHTADRVSRKS